MSFTYPLTPPAAPLPKNLRLYGRSAVAQSESPFTFSQYTYAHPGKRWRMEFTLPPMRRADAEAWVAFLLKLNNNEGTFLYGDPVGRTPRGAGGGTPLVNGGGQTGQQLATDGWPNATTVLRAGDYVQLGTGATTRLYKVLTDATTNGSGQVTLDLWPNLRVAPSDNAALVINGAQGLWRLASNEAAWDIGEAQIYGLAIAAVEAV